MEKLKLWKLCDTEFSERDLLRPIGIALNGLTHARLVADLACDYSKDQFVLLDCGYGILSQMTSLHGLEKTKHILRNIGFIFISHGHPDHHGVSSTDLINKMYIV